MRSRQGPRNRVDSAALGCGFLGLLLAGLRPVRAQSTNRKSLRLTYVELSEAQRKKHRPVKLVAELERRGFRTVARRTRASAPAEPRRSKNAELDAAAARGIGPAKPDVTSHANHHYQKRFDRLAELAAAGDWDAVRAYECTGVNSYAKMVRQYRDRLLAAQAASTAAV